MTSGPGKSDRPTAPEKIPNNFGPFAIDDRRPREEGKPETFNFLGFTHICAKRSNGRYRGLWQTIGKGLQAKLHQAKAELQRRMLEPIPVLGKQLQAVVREHIRDYCVPMNTAALPFFRFEAGSSWHRALSRRSQNGRVLWDHMRRLITTCWLPPPSVCHPDPLRRMGVITEGESRMRYCRSSGSVEKVVSNHDPYSDLSLSRFGPRRLFADFRFCSVD